MQSITNNFSTLQHFYIQHTEFSFIQKNKLKLKFIIILIIVKLKENKNKNKKILYTNFRNFFFIYEGRITFYRLQEKVKYIEDREMEG